MRARSDLLGREQEKMYAELCDALNGRIVLPTAITPERDRKLLNQLIDAVLDNLESVH